MISAKSITKGPNISEIFFQKLPIYFINSIKIYIKKEKTGNFEEDPQTSTIMFVQPLTIKIAQLELSFPCQDWVKLNTEYIGI